MYAFNILIKNDNPNYKDFVSDSYYFVYGLERTGQIIPRKHLVSLHNNTITIPVVCPEKTALTLKNYTKHSLIDIKKIEKNCGNKIQHLLIGREAESINYKIPEKSSFYILRNGFNFPLICGDTETEIPLYKIPKTDHNGEDYDNVYFWNKNYERLSGLWFGSEYEAFAEEQLQDAYSAINKKGRELCAHIEQLTGVPTYYFLHNYRALPTEKDKQRKCPITGNNWYLKGRTAADFIAFKSDAGRVVSELSTNSNEEGEIPQRTHFELKGKTLNFIVDAVSFRMESNQELMKDKNINKNNYSDIENDTELLKIILNYLKSEQYRNK